MHTVKYRRLRSNLTEINYRDSYPVNYSKTVTNFQRVLWVYRLELDREISPTAITGVLMSILRG